MDEAKEVHSALKLAAGIFFCAREQQGQLPAQIEKATDLDIRVIESYLLQCQVSCYILSYVHIRCHVVSYYIYAILG